MDSHVTGFFLEQEFFLFRIIEEHSDPFFYNSFFNALYTQALYAFFLSNDERGFLLPKNPCPPRERKKSDCHRQSFPQVFRPVSIF